MVVFCWLAIYCKCVYTVYKYFSLKFIATAAESTKCIKNNALCTVQYLLVMFVAKKSGVQYSDIHSYQKRANIPTSLYVVIHPCAWQHNMYLLKISISQITPANLTDPDKILQCMQAEHKFHVFWATGYGMHFPFKLRILSYSGRSNGVFFLRRFCCTTHQFAVTRLRSHLPYFWNLDYVTNTVSRCFLPFSAKL